MKIALLIVVLSMVLNTCSIAGEEVVKQSFPLDQNTPSTTTEAQNRSLNNNMPINEQRVTISENSEEQLTIELREKQKRKRELELDHIKVIGVKGDLLNTIMTYLVAVKEKDDTSRLNIIYNSDNFVDYFNEREEYISAVTMLVLDSSRVKAVSDEYSLREFAQEVAIVKIEFRSLNDLLEETLSDGDYIFVKVNGKWRLYRTQ